MFPESPRVVYGLNPLLGVFCQVEFPADLKIDTQTPMAFQERIRQQYPFFTEARGALLPGLITASPNLPIRVGNATYLFTDEVASQAVWSVELTQSTLRLSTSKYQRWEEFWDHLSGPLQALIDVYSPPFFARLGLRYQDLIQRSALSLTGVPWKDLLNSAIAGVLTINEDESRIEGSQGQAVIALAAAQRVRLQHGLVKLQSSPEQCYLIDNDFYVEGRMEVTDARTIFDSLNKASGRFFRWCISERLHRALDPHPME